MGWGRLKAPRFITSQTQTDRERSVEPPPYQNLDDSFHAVIDTIRFHLLRKERSPFL